MEKGRSTRRDGDDFQLILEQGQELEKREEHPAETAARDQCGDAAASSLIDIEAPAVRGKRFELEQQAREEEHQRSVMPIGPLIEPRSAIRSSMLSIPVTAYSSIVPIRKNVDARTVAMMYLKVGRQRRGRVAQAEQAIGGDRDDLQENEEIEQVTGHHHALDAHDDQQVKQHRPHSSRARNRVRPAARSN